MKIQFLLKKTLIKVILSIIIGFFIGAIVLLLAGFNPINAYAALIYGIFSKPRYVAQVIIKGTPLILTGLSVTFAFKSGLFNIGGEGQYIIGSIFAVLAGYLLKLPPFIHFFVVIITGALAAGFWGSIVGYLKAKLGIHEVITSIMLNWVAFYLNNYMVSLPWLAKPDSDSSYPINKTAWDVVLNGYKTSAQGRRELLESRPILSDVLLKTDFNYGILIAIIICLLVWVLLKHTKQGFEFRAVGSNKYAAEFAGMNMKKTIILSMFISGAIAGLAGALQITGTTPHRIGLLSAQEGYGFDGISVALVGCLSPLGCILAGLLFGALKYGGVAIQSVIGAPSEIISIIIGIIVFMIAMSPIFEILSNFITKRQSVKVENSFKKKEGLE